MVVCARDGGFVVCEIEGGGAGGFGRRVGCEEAAVGILLAAFLVEGGGCGEGAVGW